MWKQIRKREWLRNSIISMVLGVLVGTLFCVLNNKVVQEGAEQAVALKNDIAAEVGNTPTNKSTPIRSDDSKVEDMQVLTESITSQPASKPTETYWERVKDVEFTYSLNVDILSEPVVQKALASKVSYLYSKYLGIDEYKVSCEFTQGDADMFPGGVCIYAEDSNIYVNYRCKIVQREGSQLYMEYKTFQLFYGEGSLQISIKE